MKFFVILSVFLVKVDSFQPVHHQLVQNHVDFFQKQGNFSMMEPSVKINKISSGLASYQCLHGLTRFFHNIFFVNHWKAFHMKELSETTLQIDWKYESYSQSLLPPVQMNMNGTSIYTLQQHEKVKRHDIQNILVKIKLVQCEGKEDCPGTMSCCSGLLYNYCCHDSYIHPLHQIPVTVKA